MTLTNMKKSLFIIALINLKFSLDLYSQEVVSKYNCNEFKNGSFYYPSNQNYGYSIRENQTQKSFISSKNMWITWDVNWLDSCKYELVFPNDSAIDGSYFKGDRIVTDIIKSENECYWFKSVLYNKKFPNGKEFPIGEMCKKSTDSKTK